MRDKTPTLQALNVASQYPAPSSVWGSRIGSVRWLMRRKQALTSHSCAHSAFHWFYSSKSALSGKMATTAPDIIFSNKRDIFFF